MAPENTHDGYVPFLRILSMLNNFEAVPFPVQFGVFKEVAVHFESPFYRRDTVLIGLTAPGITAGGKAFEYFHVGRLRFSL